LSNWIRQFNSLFLPSLFSLSCFGLTLSFAILGTLFLHISVFRVVERLVKAVLLFLFPLIYSFAACLYCSVVLSMMNFATSPNWVYTVDECLMLNDMPSWE